VRLDEHALSDAAYVLGALSPDERREFEAHLPVCAACAASVGELAGLPGLMSRVSLDQLTAEPEPLPDTLLPSLARAVRRERRRRITFGAAAAAAAFLIAAGGVAIIGHSAGRPQVPPSASRPSATAPSGAANLALTAVVPSPVTASARLVDVPWGTRIELTCAYRTSARYPASATPYALVVIDRSGVAEQVATWKALPNRTLTVTGASSRARRDIASIEIRTLTGRPILRLSM